MEISYRKPTFIRKVGDEEKPTLGERIVLLHRGRVCFDKAVELLRRDKNHYSSEEGLVEIAQQMDGLGIPLAPIVDLLQKRLPKSRERSWVLRDLAKVQALLGNYDPIKQSGSDPWGDTWDYFFAIEVQISRDEDPTELLTSVEKIIRGYRVSPRREAVTESFGHQVGVLGRLATLYVKAGMIEDARRVFSDAEAILERSRDQYNEALKRAKNEGKKYPEPEQIALNESDLGDHEQEYHQLGIQYASVSWFEDASRMADRLNEDDSHYFSDLIGAIVAYQLRDGQITESGETAKRLGGPILLRGLAIEAMQEVESNGDYLPMVEKIESILSGELSDTDYASWLAGQSERAAKGGNFLAAIHHLKSASMGDGEAIELWTLIGLIASKAKDEERARTYFSKAWEIIESADEAIFTSGLQFTPKEMVILQFLNIYDEAGYDATEICQDLLALLAFDPEVKSSQVTYWDEKHSMLVELVEYLCENGYFRLVLGAVDVFEEYDEEALWLKLKPKNVADIGNALAKLGPTVEDLAALTTDHLQALAQKGEEVQKAIKYLQLSV